VTVIFIATFQLLDIIRISYLVSHVYYHMIICRTSFYYISGFQTIMFTIDRKYAA